MSEVDKLLDALERQRELIAGLRNELHAKDKRIADLEAITGGIAAYLKATYKHLPADVDFHYKLPTTDDKRFWIDALSWQFAQDNKDDETGSTDPVVDTFEIVPTSIALEAAQADGRTYSEGCKP